MFLHDANMISFVVILAASSIPLYLSFKLKHELKILTVLLALFLVSHASYHIFDAAQIEFGQRFIEPFSVLVLIIFGIAMVKVKQKYVIIR